MPSKTATVTTTRTIVENDKAGVYVSDDSKPLLARLVVFLWTAMMILAAIFLIVALTLPDWVEGKVNDNKYEVGLFEQCVNDKCEDITLGDGAIGEWTGASALFIIGLIFLIVTIILTCIVGFGLQAILVLWAKALLSFSNLLFIIAALLFPIGFDKLDSDCDQGDEGQCGLPCGNSASDFDYFILCAPFELGAGAILMVTGLIILFLSACCAVCVRVDLEY